MLSEPQTISPRRLDLSAKEVNVSDVAGDFYVITRPWASDLAEAPPLRLLASCAMIGAGLMLGALIAIGVYFAGQEAVTKLIRAVAG